MSISQRVPLQLHEEEFLAAAEAGDLKMLRGLLAAHGSRLLAVFNKLDETALHLAAKMGHEMAVNMLVEQGADVSAPGFSGETPLYEAAYEGHLEIVRYLLDSGAQIDAVCASGTPLMGSMYQGHHDVMRLLLDRGALVHKDSGDEDQSNLLIDEDEMDALVWVRQHNDPVILKEFVARGLIPVEAPHTVLDWLMAGDDDDVSKLVVACLDNPELGGTKTVKEMRVLLEHGTENEDVKAVLRAEVSRLELVEAMGGVILDELPTPAPASQRSSGMGL
jgi:hypothetical protein